MFIEPVMIYNSLISCHPLLFFLQSFPASGSFLMNQLFTSGGQNFGPSAPAPILPMNIQGGFSLGLTDLIFLKFKGLSRVFSKKKKSLLQHHTSTFFATQPKSTVQISHPYNNYWKNHSFDYMDLCQQRNVSAFLIMLSRFVISLLPRSKHVLNSWLQSPFAVILEPKKIKSFTASTFYPSICHEVIGLDAMILVFWTLSFNPVFSLSSFSLIIQVL